MNDKQLENCRKFIEKAKIVHKNENIDYTNIEYVDNRTNVCLVDHDLKEDGTEYGEFWQTPSNHLRGQSHPLKRTLKYRESRGSKQQDVIERFKKVHEGENLDYSEVEYVNMHTKVKIIDHDLREDGTEYGEFWQEPAAHLKKCKHPDKCKNKHAFTIGKALTNEAFITKAIEIHGDKYDYSKVIYTNSHNKVIIICKKHGEFLQNPNNHLMGKGCPICGNETISAKKVMSQEEWEDKGNKLYDNYYDYSKAKYVNAKTKLCIICPKHGEFWQESNSHIMGCGCPKCSSTFSKAEEYISKYIQELGIEIIQNDRRILDGLELDIYIPSHNVAIEYDGLFWHSEKFGKDKYYHLNKTLQCKEKGIKLIHVFEDEFLEHKDIVINKISHILNIKQELPKIMGRKCTIEIIDNDTAKSFLNTYHIQGYGASTIHLGAVYGDELIAVMSFKKEGKDCLKWELTRFASHNNYICQGVGGKLFKYFINTYNPQEVKSFADRRWTLDEEDNLYTKLGFELGDVLAPDYKYIEYNKRMHKFGFRKRILNKKYGLPLTMTEKEMVESLGIKKIWDCGLLKYIWKQHD